MEENRLDKEALQFKRMTETPVKPLILRLAIPTIISMLVTGIYNTADTLFVSQLGKSASGAVGIVFALSSIISAVGFLIGMGAGSIVSRELGKRNNDEANKVASCSILFALIMSIIMVILGTIFLDQIVNLLGATPTIFPYAVSYAKYVIFAIPFIVLSFVLNILLRSEGKAKFSMVGLTFGGILNIALDPLFITTFNLGTAGAAIATGISQAISFFILASFFVRKKSVIIISFRGLKGFLKNTFNITKAGAPSFLRQILSCLASIILNNQSGAYGDAAVSAMSIVTKIFMLVFCVVLGFGQAYQPVVGYNYGAKKWGRLKEAGIFTWILGTLGMTTLGAVCFVIAPDMISWFINDAEVIEIGAVALRAQCIAMPLVTTGVICNMTYQSMGKKLAASIFATFRQGIFFIPALLILPKYFELAGVEYAQAIADVLTFAICLPCLIIYFRNLTKKETITNKVSGV